MKDAIYVIDTHQDLPRTIISLQDSSKPPENASNAVLVVKSRKAEAIFDLLCRTHILYSECGPGTHGEIWTCLYPWSVVMSVKGAASVGRTILRSPYIGKPMYKHEILIDKFPDGDLSYLKYLQYEKRAQRRLALKQKHESSTKTKVRQSTSKKRKSSTHRNP